MPITLFPDYDDSEIQRVIHDLVKVHAKIVYDDDDYRVLEHNGKIYRLSKIVEIFDIRDFYTR